MSKIIILGFTSISVILLVYFLVTVLTENKNELPILGEPGHVAGNFSFTNQDGVEISQDDIKGKIAVVEYFFTSCPGICREMNKNLQRVHQVYRNNPDFVLLSHTVDPERDSVAVLAAYARKMQAHPKGWYFLTGDKYTLYTAAKKDYLLAVEEASVPTGSDEDFIHTQYVALLDQQRRIRGFYDATDSLRVDELITAIKLLINE